MNYYGSITPLPLDRPTMHPLPPFRAPAPARRAPHALAAWLMMAAVCSACAQSPVAPPAASPATAPEVAAPESTAPAVTQAAEPAAPPLPSGMTGRLMYELLVAELLLQEGDGATATRLMLDAARRTDDEAVYQRAVEAAIQSRSGPAALEATRAWRQAFPASPEASQYELQVHIVLGRVAEAEAPLRRFLAVLPEADKEALITALPALFQRVPDKAEAARVVERGLADALQDKRLAPAAWTSIGRLRLQAGDNAGALAAATLGQTADADSEWPALLALQLYAADVAEAEALVQRHLARPAAKPELRINYARALAEKNRPAQAHEQLADLILQQPKHPDAWLLQGALYADMRDDARAETALRHYLALSEAEPPAPDVDRRAGQDQARLMLARIAERRGDVAAARALLDGIESPEQAMAVAQRRATLLAREGRLQQARALIRAVPERSPEDARLKLLTEAHLLRDHQQPLEAYQLLSAELANAPDDEALLYDTAMAAERKGNVDEMERLLRRLIAVNPESANAYNALGYTLADRGVRLEEARQLIEKAVQLSPGDSFIQDSLGWVEYRLGHTQKARDILQAAYATRPDPEIAAHLGEVLWALGQHDAARSAWRDGMRLDPDNKTLRKTLDRFKVSLP
ncbi:MAG: tetratricopeptide repeat protein [Pseudomonadota bacterium]|nr:tetratricopeptide repeat protein [Pseudomonadota bacterium]